MRRLVLASAGAGKSRLVVEHARQRIREGKKILILTYTEKNQKELASKFCEINGIVPSKVHIKGWYSFLLEDMIRPYQSYIFKTRIPGIYFNDVDPHKRNGRNIPGRAEILDGIVNRRYYLTDTGERAHTTYLSKLAVRVNAAAGKKCLQRLTEIYGSICIDEVQDLTGWDFDIIKSISKSTISEFCCVGDFRQTLYTTHPTNKKPKSNLEKQVRFKEIGLTVDQLNVSWRCIQKLCVFADFIHDDEGIYAPTESKLEDIDIQCSDHNGVFVVRSDNVMAYLERFQPTILRTSRNTRAELCEKRIAYNFGEAKGMGFDRVLICATEKHRKFLAGNKAVFAADRTAKAKNTLYVAVTRARYSVAFIYDGEVNMTGVEVWTP